jgi:hypothetical protein
MANETTPPEEAGEVTATEPAPPAKADEATQTLMQQAAAPTNAQQNACLDCLLQGLSAIGINAPANATIDFGAVDSDDLCAALAHSIEQCLFAKGWNVKPLAASFINLRATGARVTIVALTNALVKLSWSVGEEE